MPTALLAARCSTEHHLVVTRRKLHFQNNKKKHKFDKCGILGAQAQQAAVGRLCRRLGRLTRWKMEVSSTQLKLRLKPSTKVMFSLLNWHLLAFKRPQQQIERKLWGKIE